MEVDKSLVPYFVGYDRLDRDVRRLRESQQGVAHKPTGDRLDVLDRQHVDVLEDVPVGDNVGVPVFNAGVDARVVFRSSCSCHCHLHDVVKPKLSCLILEKIENLLSVCQGDGEWFPSLLRLGGLGPLVFSFLSVNSEQLGVVGGYRGRLLRGGGCGGGWWDVCRGCIYSRYNRVQDRCDKRCEAGGVDFWCPIVALGITCVCQCVTSFFSFVMLG